MVILPEIVPLAIYIVLSDEIKELYKFRIHSSVNGASYFWYSFNYDNAIVFASAIRADETFEGTVTITRM